MRVDCGFTASEIVARFVCELERDPAFEPPSQIHRVRCDYCGAFHPSPQCARCLPFLEEARHVCEESRRKERRQRLRERLRLKHAARRTTQGYALHHCRNHQRRVLYRRSLSSKRWIEHRVGWSALALHSVVVLILLKLWLKVPEARAALGVTLLLYLGVVALLVRRPESNWRRGAIYERWHGLRVGKVPLSPLVHWGIAVAMGGSVGGSLQRFADPAPPFASLATSAPPTGATPTERFWSSAADWDAWDHRGAVGTLAGDALALQGHSRAKVAAFSDLGRAMRYISIAPDGTFALASSADGTLTRFRTKDGALLATLSLGGALRDVAIAPDGTFAYVVQESENRVVRVRLSASIRDNFVAARIPVGSSPSSVSFSRDGDLAVVSNHGAGTLSLIRTADDMVIETLKVGSPAWEAAFAPDGAIYVANDAGNHLRIWHPNASGEPNTNSKNDVPLSGGPWDVSVSGGFLSGGLGARSPAIQKTLALVAHEGAPLLSRIEVQGKAMAKLVATIKLLTPAWDVAIAPEGNYAFASPNANELFVVDLETNRVSQRLMLQGAPREIAFAPDGRFALVATGNGVTRIEGGAPTYTKCGVAQTWVGQQERNVFSHLTKNEVLNGGRITYFYRCSATKTALPVPPTSEAAALGAWQGLGWRQVQWSGNRANLPKPPPDQPELHLAIHLTTLDKRRSPVLKALRWSLGVQ